MSEIWTLAAQNFRQNDDMPSTLQLKNLTPTDIARVFSYFQQLGEIASSHATVWDELLKRDVQLVAIPDVPKMLLQERLSPFYCVFKNLRTDHVIIPDLGLHVFLDLVEIDYLSGSHWNMENVDAFFHFLARLLKDLPNAKVESSERDGVVDEAAFLQALKLAQSDGQ